MCTAVETCMVGWNCPPDTTSPAAYLERTGVGQGDGDVLAAGASIVVFLPAFPCSQDLTAALPHLTHIRISNKVLQ